METQTLAQQKQTEFQERIMRANSDRIIVPPVSLKAPPLVQIKPMQEVTEQEEIEVVEEELEQVEEPQVELLN